MTEIMPERIWLQNCYGEIDWCSEQHEKGDVEYIRKDAVTAQISVLETEVALLRRKLELLESTIAKEWR